MSDITNLKIRKETKELIDILVKEHGGLQRDYIHKMVVYFQSTGTNPDSFTMPSPAQELKKFRDTIIGFMRKQEADYIKPTFGKMNSMMEMMVRVIEEQKPKEELKTKPIVKDEKALVVPNSDPVKDEKDSLEIRRLSNELESKKRELATMKSYFMEICNSVKKTNTGLQMKNVVMLDEAKFEDHYKWLRNLSVEEF